MHRLVHIYRRPQCLKYRQNRPWYNNTWIVQETFFLQGWEMLGKLLQQVHFIFFLVIKDCYLQAFSSIYSFITKQIIARHFNMFLKNIVMLDSYVFVEARKLAFNHCVTTYVFHWSVTMNSDAGLNSQNVIWHLKNKSIVCCGFTVWPSSAVFINLN